MKKPLLLLAALFLSTYSFAIPKTGKINNIVILINFKDSSPIDSVFRNTTIRVLNGEFPSIQGYFYQASYGKLNMQHHVYPTVDDPANPHAVFCYTDTNPANYYRVKSDSNPIGFDGIGWEPEALEREYALVKRAIAFVQQTTPVDSNLNIDMDHDGYVDNVSFIFNANEINMFDILWAHMSGMITNINMGNIYGKIVNRYSFTAYNKGPHISGMAHELGHALGAIHFYSTEKRPIGVWDIMDEVWNYDFYFHPTAYNKWLSFKWIDTIPEITKQGTYILQPLFSDTNNCYQIKSPVSEHEYFILEYRKKAMEKYENILFPGLTIMRVNDLPVPNGLGNNAYLYRASIEGVSEDEELIKYVTFSDAKGNTNFNSYTSNPPCLLSYGDKGGISISNIKENEDGTLSFTFDGFDVEPSFQGKDTVVLFNMRNFTNYYKIKSTNISTWALSSIPDWIDVNNNYASKQIDFKTLSVNNTSEPRLGKVDITIRGKVIKTITLIQNPSPTATTLSHEVTDFSVYPNPVPNGELKVESGELINSIEIFNLFGQKVFSQTTNQNTITISVNHLPKGVYVVRCKFANGSMNHARVIIN